MTSDFPGIYRGRNGKWYLRGGGVLPGHPSESREASNAYWAWKAGKKPDSVKRTMKVLVASYLGSPAFKQKADNTQQSYLRYANRIADAWPTRTVASVERKDIIALRDGLANTPGKANYYLSVLSVLFEHAIDLGLRKDNPAKGVKKLKGGDGYQPWPAGAIDAYRKASNGIARTVFELCLGTGQRVGDVLRMRWDDIEDNGIWVKQGKTGTKLLAPMTRDLRDYLATLPKAGLTIATMRNGKPVLYRYASERAYEARKASRTLDYHMHGLRATRAAQLAEGGATDAQIQAVTGHKTQAMVAYYRRGADQKKLAKGLE